jgi:S1-C subfamily serine protease
MRLLTLAAAALFTCALAAAADAQQPAASRTGKVSVQGAPGRPRVPYTGINVSGRPQFSPGGAFRWATHPTAASVDSGSPAYRVGIRAGDVVLLVNGSDARDPETLVGQPGKVYVFRIRRGTQLREYTVTSTAVPVPTGGRG